jgi:pumilio RNA-binding family
VPRSKAPPQRAGAAGRALAAHEIVIPNPEPSPQNPGLCPSRSEAIYADVIRLAPSLARHKYASNVVEACLTHGTPRQRDALMDALLMLPSGAASSSAAAAAAAAAGVDSQQPGAGGPRHAGVGAVALGPGAVAQAAGLARDQFGNYVLQRALEVAGEPRRAGLLRALCPLADSLRRSTYGKHIAARVARMQAALEGAEADEDAAPTRDDPGASAAGAGANGDKARVPDGAASAFRQQV